MRSSQEIPDVITGTLSTNDKQKKLKANMDVVQTSCMSNSVPKPKVQSTVGSGEPQQAPRRQVRVTNWLLIHSLQNSITHLK